MGPSLSLKAGFLFPARKPGSLICYIFWVCWTQLRNAPAESVSREEQPLRKGDERQCLSLILPGSHVQVKRQKRAKPTAHTQPDCAAQHLLQALVLVTHLHFKETPSWPPLGEEEGSGLYEGRVCVRLSLSDAALMLRGSHVMGFQPRLPTQQPPSPPEAFLETSAGFRPLPGRQGTSVLFVPKDCDHLSPILPPEGNSRRSETSQALGEGTTIQKKKRKKFSLSSQLLSGFQDESIKEPGKESPK